MSTTFNAGDNFCQACRVTLKILNAGKNFRFIQEKQHLIRLLRNLRSPDDIWMKKEQGSEINLKKQSNLLREKLKRPNNILKMLPKKQKIKLKKPLKKLVLVLDQLFLVLNLMSKIKQKQ